VRGLIIVLEGADGVGKTTLADALEELLSREGGRCVRMRSGPSDDPYADCSKAIALAEAASALGRHVIIDRLHAGERVYGPMLRGGSRITLEMARALNRRLIRMRAILAHCTAPVDVIKGRLINRDGGAPDAKSGAKLEQAYEIQARFSDVLGRSSDWIGAELEGWRHIDMRSAPATIAAALVALGRERNE
jgi:thymidylate kinase